MLAHGINHIFGGGKIEGTGRWFESLGMKPGLLHAWLASVTEIVGGALLILGLLPPLGGAATVGVLAVAGITTPRGNGFFLFLPGQGWASVLPPPIPGLHMPGLGP